MIENDESAEQPPRGKPREEQACTWAMLAHLAGLAGFIPLVPVPAGNIFGALIVWLIKKDEFDFVDNHGKEALNFQILVSVCAVLALVLTRVIVGWVLLGLLAIADIVLVIQAALVARKGEVYRYPATLRLIR